LTIKNNPSGVGCTLSAYVSAPPMTEGGTFVLRGNPGFWPPLGFILDLPVDRESFGLRIFLTGAELNKLSQGYSPLWKSFLIKKRDDIVSFQVFGMGETWSSPPGLEFLPDKITLKTDLLFCAPQIVRDYRMKSNVPKKFSRSDDRFS